MAISSSLNLIIRISMLSMTAVPLLGMIISKDISFVQIFNISEKFLFVLVLQFKSQPFHLIQAML